MAYPKVFRALFGKIEDETAKAVKFTYCSNQDEVDEFGIPAEYKTEWFPKSQLGTMSPGPVHDIMMVNEWLLGQKNLMHLARTAPPAQTKVPDVTLADKLKTPPSPNFSDMDKDIPF